MNPHLLVARSLLGAVGWAAGVGGVVVLGMAVVMPWVEPDFRDAPLVGVAFLTALAVASELVGAALYLASRWVSREGTGRVLGLVAAAGLLMVCNPLFGAYVAFALLGPEPAPTSEVLPDAEPDLHEQAAGWVLLLAAAPVLLLGILAIPGGFLVGATAPEFGVHPGGPLVAGLGISLAESALFLGLGALPAAAGLGVLRRPSPASWGRAVAVAALLLGTGCLAPLGGWALYGLVRARTRARFGVR